MLLEELENKFYAQGKFFKSPISKGLLFSASWFRLLCLWFILPFLSHCLVSENSYCVSVVLWLILLFFHNALCLRTVIVYPSWLSCGLYLRWCSEVKENMLILPRQCRYIVFSDVYKPSQGAKKVSFMACHSGKLRLAFTNPKFISTSPKNVLISRIDYTVLL